MLSKIRFPSLISFSNLPFLLPFLLRILQKTILPKPPKHFPFIFRGMQVSPRSLCERFGSFNFTSTAKSLINFCIGEFVSQRSRLFGQKTKFRFVISRSVTRTFAQGCHGSGLPWCGNALGNLLTFFEVTFEKCFYEPRAHKFHF